MSEYPTFFKPEAKGNPIVRWQDRKKPINKASDKQKEINERLKFYRAVWLDVQKKTQGHFSCCECNGVFDTNQLHLHHITRRSRGGEHHFSNLILICGGPGTNLCHERADNNDLRWSSKSVAGDGLESEGKE